MWDGPDIAAAVAFYLVTNDDPGELQYEDGEATCAGSRIVDEVGTEALIDAGFTSATDVVNIGDTGGLADEVAEPFVASLFVCLDPQKLGSAFAAGLPSTVSDDTVLCLGNGLQEPDAIDALARLSAQGTFSLSSDDRFIVGAPYVNCIVGDERTELVQASYESAFDTSAFDTAGIDCVVADLASDANFPQLIDVVSFEADLSGGAGTDLVEAAEAACGL